jgi:hypothetical protein
VHLVAALGPLLDVGTAPMATFATALSIGATYRIFALEATSALAPSQSYAPPSGTLRASFAWQSFGARAAVRVGFAFAFLGVDVTRVRARGESGVDVPTSGAITRAAATIGAGARFTAIGPLGLRVEGELLLPRTKPRYVVATDDGAREVDTSGAVAFRTRISLEIVW